MFGQINYLTAFEFFRMGSDSNGLILPLHNWTTWQLLSSSEWDHIEGNISSSCIKSQMFIQNNVIKLTLHSYTNSVVIVILYLSRMSSVEHQKTNRTYVRFLW
jgi:hypothetical protein